MEDVARKKQNFFQVVDSASEKKVYFESLSQSRGPLFLKYSIDPVTNENLTRVKPYQYGGTRLLATYQDGPQLVNAGRVTTFFEARKAKLFGIADLTLLRGEDYSLAFKNLYQLQRRDAYRVHLPSDLIKAVIKLVTLDDSPSKQELRVVDLSTGGCGLEVSPESAPMFDPGTVLVGKLFIGAHPGLTVKGLVKYRRKNVQAKPDYIHTGCQFKEMTTADSEKISFIVNDCHRQFFSKLHAQG